MHAYHSDYAVRSQTQLQPISQEALLQPQALQALLFPQPIQGTLPVPQAQVPLLWGSSV